MGRKSEGYNWRLCFAIAAAAVGSAFQHGYNTGVVNAPQELIEDWIFTIMTNRTGLMPEQNSITMVWSVAVAIFCVGGMIGGSITGIVSNRFGCKGALLLNNILVLLAVILQSSAKSAGSYEMVILGRLIIGINSGLNAGLAPIYLAEISPISLRGSVGTVYQLVITISILISQVFGMETLLGTAKSWPILFAVTLVPAVFQILTLPFCPESPKYLMLNQGKELEAQNALAWLRGTIEVHDEMEDMRQESERMKITVKVTLYELIKKPSLRQPLIIASVIMVSQQFCGINAAMFYSTKVFKMAGLDDFSAQQATIGMGAMNVLMTGISLILVEKAGRKTLLLIGFLGMFAVTLLLTIAMQFVDSAQWVSYACIVLVIVFVVMFATGPGSIPWFLVTELFDQGARPAATSLAVAINWAANFIVGLGFLPLQNVLHGYVFLIFVILQALFAIFIYRKVPETKNKTVEEITAMFRRQY